MTYTYSCPEHKLFTIDRSIKEEPLRKCPQCGKEITQIFSNTSGTIVNCTGFYGKSSK